MPQSVAIDVHLYTFTAKRKQNTKSRSEIQSCSEAVVLGTCGDFIAVSESGLVTDFGPFICPQDNQDNSVVGSTFRPFQMEQNLHWALTGCKRTKVQPFLRVRVPCMMSGLSSGFGSAAPQVMWNGTFLCGDDPLYWNCQHKQTRHHFPICGARITDPRKL